MAYTGNAYVNAPTGIKGIFVDNRTDQRKNVYTFAKETPEFNQFKNMYPDQVSSNENKTWNNFIAWLQQNKNLMNNVKNYVSNKIVNFNHSRNV